MIRRNIILNTALSTIMILFTAPSLYAKDVDLINPSGEKIGTATILAKDNGVHVAIQASKLPPGEHGIHFHETGICALPDFKTAGEHFRPGGKEHGLKNPKGPHEGDLPNLEVKEDGTVTAEMDSKLVTLKGGKKSLLKQGGTALVIHAKPDDQLSNPSGNSGDRIACAVID